MSHLHNCMLHCWCCIILKNGVGAGGGADMKPQLSQVIEKGTRGPMVLYPLT